jgi:hypothetical protein
MEDEFFAKVGCYAKSSLLRSIRMPSKAPNQVQVLAHFIYHSCNSGSTPSVFSLYRWAKRKRHVGRGQLCVGLEPGIKGEIHAMRLLWQTHKAEEEWGFLLVDANNVLNDGRYSWSGQPTGLLSFSTATSKEGVAQGNPVIEGCPWHPTPPARPFSQGRDSRRRSVLVCC